MGRTMDGPDIFLGDSEGDPPHWGGAPRRGYILGHPALTHGTAASLMRVDPAIPDVDGLMLDEVIVTARYAGESVDRIGAGAIIVHLLRPMPGVDIHKAAFVDGDLVIQFWADAATSLEALPKPIDRAALWQQTLERIDRFIEEFGHAQIPSGYHDGHGQLDIIVGNLRWHHAGKGGVSPGPFPGIDYAADLNRLPGWTW